MKQLRLSYLIGRFIQLWYWVKVWTEGRRLRDKAVLFPNAMVRVMQYVVTSLASFISTLFNELLARGCPEVTVENKLGLFKCRAKSNDIIIVSEANEREFTNYLLSKKPRVFVDIGANIGRYTIPMAKRADRVVAIDADPENFQALMTNITLNKAWYNIEAVERACWREETVLPIIVAPIDKKGMSSMVVGQAGREVMVRCSTLDSILAELGIEEVDLVKMDIEGAEKQAILGMKEVVKRSPHIEILFEAFNREYLSGCVEALRSIGITAEPVAMGSSMYKVIK